MIILEKDFKQRKQVGLHTIKIIFLSKDDCGKTNCRVEGCLLYHLFIYMCVCERDKGL